MQKAADAGALAGAVYLPGDVPKAYSAAAAEAKKNGYVTGTNGVVVNAVQDSTNRRRLKVTITSPVQAYFAKVFCAVSTCTNQISETVVGTAEFTLPVPMGSPQNYYGVGTYVYNQVNTNHKQQQQRHRLGCRGQLSKHRLDESDQGKRERQQLHHRHQQWPGADSGTRSACSRAAAACRMTRRWSSTGWRSSLPTSTSAATGTSTNCYVRVEVSWNGGSSWSSAQNTSALNTIELDRQDRRQQQLHVELGRPLVELRRLQQFQLPRPTDVVRGQLELLQQPHGQP